MITTFPDPNNLEEEMEPRQLAYAVWRQRDAELGRIAELQVNRRPRSRRRRRIATAAGRWTDGGQV